MLFATIIQIVRLFVESIFCYFVYNHKNKDIIFQKHSIRKMMIFSFTHVMLLLLYRYFLTDYTTYRLVSVFIIFAYFLIEDWIENKKVKNWSYILTFSIFITLIMDCSQFTSAIINRISWQYAGIYELSETNFLLDKVYRFTVLVSHVCFMFLIYKIRFIKMKDIKNLSVHREIPILFGLCLSTVVYIKYHYNQLGVSIYSSILAWLFLFLAPTYLSFYHSLSKLSRLKNMERNELDDINLEEKIEQPLLCKVFSLDQYRCEHKPCAAKYEADKIAFKRVLRQLGINSGFKGFTQLVFSLLLTRNFLNYNKGWTIENNVINYIALATGEKPSEIRKDFGNIIRKVWLLEDLQVIKKGYSNTADEDNPPSVDEFLVNMAKKPIVDEAYMLNEQMF